MSTTNTVYTEEVISDITQPINDLLNAVTKNTMDTMMVVIVDSLAVAGYKSFKGMPVRMGEVLGDGAFIAAIQIMGKGMLKPPAPVTPTVTP